MMAPAKLANVMSTDRNDLGFLNTLVRLGHTCRDHSPQLRLRSPICDRCPEFSCLLFFRRAPDLSIPVSSSPSDELQKEKENTINFSPTTDEPKKK